MKCECGVILPDEDTTILCSCGLVKNPKPGVVYKSSKRISADILDSRGYEKANICRSNQCGQYDSANDTCKVLTDRGKRGLIPWLYTNPDAKCVSKDPLF